MRSLVPCYEDEYGYKKRSFERGREAGLVPRQSLFLDPTRKETGNERVKFDWSLLKI